MRKQIIYCILFFIFSYSSPLFAYDLIMVTHSKCKFCIAWKNEVLPEYKISKFAKIFKLDIIDISDGPPSWLDLSRIRSDINRTPTFLFWDRYSNREIARINGYNPGNPDYFFQLLEDIYSILTKNKNYIGLYGY